MPESQTVSVLIPQSLPSHDPQAVVTAQPPDQVTPSDSWSSPRCPENTAKVGAVVAKARLGAFVEWLPLMSFLASIAVFMWTFHHGRNWAFAVMLLAASILFLMINNESNQQGKKD